MQKCNKCMKEFTFKEVFKSLYTNSKLNCKSCKTSHVITRSSNFKYKLICLGIPVLIGVRMRPYSYALAVVFVVISAVALMSLFSYIVKFEIRTERSHIRGRW